MPQSRWKNRPEGSTWGDFGPDDSLGRLNLIGSDQVLKGIREVVDGRVFSLSLPLDFPGGMALNPNRFPPIVRPSLRRGNVNFNCDMSVAFPGATDVMSDDLVVLHTQYSTQWDAFGHEGAVFDADGDGIAEKVYYNGWAAGKEVNSTTDPNEAGVHSLGSISGAEQGLASTSDAGPVDISHAAVHGIQGRAVLIDLYKHYGTAAVSIGYRQLAEVLEKDKIVIETGDILLLHTGFAREVLSWNKEPNPEVAANTCTTLDGADPELRKWITDSGIAAIAADNYAVETFPALGAGVGDPVLPLHEHCLFRIGVHLGELWYLSDLADYLTQSGRYRVLLTAPPLRISGAAGSPVTPIATV